MMPRVSLAVWSAAALLAMAPHLAKAAVRKVPYPEVRVEITAPHPVEPAFQSFRKAFADAVASRDTEAMFKLVGPMFTWTAQGALVGEFDPGRDALHNFKVVFGFRQQGKDTDGGVENGPYWDELTQFATDANFYSASDKTGMICGPLLAEVTDADVLEDAQNRIAIGDDAGTWFFVTGDTPVTRAPGDTGAPVGRLGKVAFPVISSHPPVKESEPPAPPTHYEVLMPSGASGWIAAGGARPLTSNRLCYARTTDGQWVIVGFDQGEDGAN
jgi:hypothetical protein